LRNKRYVIIDEPTMPVALERQGENIWSNVCSAAIVSDRKHRIVNVMYSDNLRSLSSYSAYSMNESVLYKVGIGEFPTEGPFLVHSLLEVKYILEDCPGHPIYYAPLGRVVDLEEIVFIGCMFVAQKNSLAFSRKKIEGLPSIEFDGIYICAIGEEVGQCSVREDSCIANLKPILREDTPRFFISRKKDNYEIFLMDKSVALYGGLASLVVDFDYVYEDIKAMVEGDIIEVNLAKRFINVDITQLEEIESYIKGEKEYNDLTMFIKYTPYIWSYPERSLTIRGKMMFEYFGRPIPQAPVHGRRKGRLKGKHRKKPRD